MNAAKKPEKKIYRVVQPVHREGRDKPFWLRVGTAFENPGKDGAAPTISVRLDALPIHGELVLFLDDGRPAPDTEGA